MKIQYKFSAFFLLALLFFSCSSLGVRSKEYNRINRIVEEIDLEYSAVLAGEISNSQLLELEKKYTEINNEISQLISLETIKSSEFQDLQHKLYKRIQILEDLKD